MIVRVIQLLTVVVITFSIHHIAVTQSEGELWAPADEGHQFLKTKLKWYFGEESFYHFSWGEEGDTIGAAVEQSSPDLCPSCLLKFLTLYIRVGFPGFFFLAILYPQRRKGKTLPTSATCFFTLFSNYPFNVLRNKPQMVRQG